MNNQVTLISGNKELSSWSMRAFLILKVANIKFETKFIDLNANSYKQEILKYSPSGKVPALVHGDIQIWESMAIGEYINEIQANSQLYPINPVEKAKARSLANEMHAGFLNIRRIMPFTLIQQSGYVDSVELQQEINRIEQIWQTQRVQYGNSGEFLFGEFGLVDAMFAPVAIRFIKCKN